MNSSVRILIGFFIILHGLVHPIMAVVPQPVEEQSADNPPVLGGFWTKSWLFGEGDAVKAMIYGLSVLIALTMVVAAFGFINGLAWTKIAWLAGAGLSLLLLVIFWSNYFIIGILIDVLMVIVAFATTWFTT